jgi:hypothetical protein
MAITESATWLDRDEMRLIQNAPQMFHVLKLALNALNILPRTAVRDTDTYAIAAELDFVIRRVEGRAT